MQARKSFYPALGLAGTLMFGGAGITASVADTSPAGNSAIILAHSDYDRHRPDAWVTAKVKAKLMRQHLVDLVRIDVSTEDGVVQLAGFVDRPSQAKMAEMIALDTEGVRAVQNDLIVR